MHRVTDTSTEHLPNRLRELRKAKGEKVYDLAPLIGKDPSTVTRYETGFTPMPAEVLRVFTAHFDVSTEYLLSWDRDENGAKAAA
jgi:transcriptional regulator with XRE-family HTH domain